MSYYSAFDQMTNSFLAYNVVMWFLIDNQLYCLLLKTWTYFAEEKSNLAIYRVTNKLCPIGLIKCISYLKNQIDQ